MCIESAGSVGVSIRLSEDTVSSSSVRSSGRRRGNVILCGTGSSSGEQPGREIGGPAGLLVGWPWRAPPYTLGEVCDGGRQAAGSLRYSAVSRSTSPSAVRAASAAPRNRSATRKAYAELLKVNLTFGRSSSNSAISQTAW